MTGTRRRFLQGVAAAAATAGVLPAVARGQSSAPLTRPIPSTGETIPAVGLGSWSTFNVGDDPVLRDECADVMAAFFEAGGRMIGSSPMYGSPPPLLGFGVPKHPRPRGPLSSEEERGPAP